MFEVSDSKTGYVIGFDVYTGKNKTGCYKTAKTLDPKCTHTTKTVVGLLQSCYLVGKGHHIYLNNYYSSPELFLGITLLGNILLWHSLQSKKEFTTRSDQGEAQEQG